MSPALKMCKSCGESIIVWDTVTNKCPPCLKKAAKPAQRRPIPKKGKRTKLYESWRDTIAKPYLDKKYGHICAVKGCEETENLDIDHIKGRGSHPELKMELKNLQYLCRPHHQRKTDGKL